MTRTDFQEQAELRLKEAEGLLLVGLWDGAYYLAGYAVECGLKACVAKLTKAEEFPPEPRKVAKIYSHRVEELVLSAGLKGDKDTLMAADRAFKDN